MVLTLLKASGAAFYEKGDISYSIYKNAYNKSY